MPILRLPKALIDITVLIEAQSNSIHSLLNTRFVPLERHGESRADVAVAD